MLKVWRGKSTIFAECTDCGSYGTAGHLQLKLKLSPDIEAAMERHTAHMLALRGHYTVAATNIANKVRTGELKRLEASAKIRELYENHVAQVRLGEAGLPSPGGKVQEVTATCPWCARVGEEVEVVALPDDQIEPDFELARERAALNAAANKTKKGA